MRALSFHIGSPAKGRRSGRSVDSPPGAHNVGDEMATWPVKARSRRLGEKRARRPLGLAAVSVGLTTALVLAGAMPAMAAPGDRAEARSEEHTSELQSLMRISYAVLCLKKT